MTGVSGTVNASYSYDANGNMWSANGNAYSGGSRTISYTSFNLPSQVSEGTDSFQYTYDANHGRVRLVASGAAGTSTVIYVNPAGGSGLFYEKETLPDGTVEQRDYVNAAGLVGVHVNKTGQLPEMRYYHRDQLGSILAITNDSAAPKETLSYEAFGKRRAVDGTPDLSNNIIGMTTYRGFTSQEHLDQIGLIHMNGRIYDPLLGRFTTADSIVQAPDNLQAYNRYSYTLNNPLAYIDPTGHSWWTDFRDSVLPVVVAIVVTYISDGALTDEAWAFEMSADEAALVSFRAAVFSGMYGGMTYGFLSSGGDGGATAEGMISGAISAGLFNAAGSLGFPSGGVGATAAHAAAGCIGSAASGGSCRNGALSAGFAEYAGHLLPDLGGPGFNTAKFAVIGGTASLLSKGKFANGAMTAAFGYLFNCFAHYCNGADYGREKPYFHEFGVFQVYQCQASDPNCVAEVDKAVMCGSADSGCAAVGETRNTTYAGQPITQYSPSPGFVINGTDPSHWFDDGYVVRWRGVDSEGNVRIYTYGRGNNTGFWMRLLNAIIGPPMFILRDSMISQGLNPLPY